MGANRDFWRGKRVVLTGHTGFKGGWLAIWLQRLGAEVTGISLAPETSPNLFNLGRIEQQLEHHVCDITDAALVNKLLHQARPEIVFHLAAQALVRASYRDPLATFATNVMGTAHLLDALRGVEATRVAVVVTTDKVYHNHEWHYPYRETDTLGGHDPYSASKAASELVIASYRQSFLNQQGIAVASARAGNVIGGGDWSEDRLIPDAVRSWSTNVPLEIRQPQAVRPWQHVLEPLNGYLQLAQRLWESPELAGAFNFGPRTDESATVRHVIKLAQTAYGGGEVVFHQNNLGPHEAGFLALDTSKSRRALGLQPKWSLEESVHRTMRWYLAQQQGADALRLCETDLDAYVAQP